MTDATPEQLRLARKIADELHGRRGSLFYEYAQAAAIRAIQEVTELAATFCERDIPFEHDGQVVGRCSGDVVTAQALRSFIHLKGQPHD